MRITQAQYSCAFALVIALALGLEAAGCGGSGGDSPATNSTPTPTPTVSTTPTPTPTPTSTPTATPTPTPTPVVTPTPTPTPVLTPTPLPSVPVPMVYDVSPKSGPGPALGNPTSGTFITIRGDNFWAPSSGNAHGVRFLKAYVGNEAMANPKYVDSQTIQGYVPPPLPGDLTSQQITVVQGYVDTGDQAASKATNVTFTYTN